jgi:hypothetical protein
VRADEAEQRARMRAEATMERERLAQELEAQARPAPKMGAPQKTMMSDPFVPPPGMAGPPPASKPKAVEDLPVFSGSSPDSTPAVQLPTGEMGAGRPSRLLLILAIVLLLAAAAGAAYYFLPAT